MKAFCKGTHLSAWIVIQALGFSQVLSPFAVAQPSTLRAMQGGDTSVGRRQIQTGLEEDWRHPSVEVYPDAQGRRRIRWETIPEGAGKVKLDQIRRVWAGQVFVVGGWVRDLLLGRTPNDMDLALALGSRYMTLDPAGLVEIRPEAYGDLLGESPWSESDAGQWVYRKATFQGLPIDIVHFAVDSEGIPSPEGMEFSFNRFVLGFDPVDPVDPILFDPYQAWKDLFPSEGARRGRLVRARGEALRAGPDLLDRIRRFAQDPDLRLGPLSSEDLLLLQRICQAWRRLTDTATPVWVGNRLEELGDILDRFDRWLSQPSTGLEESVGRVNLAEAVKGFRVERVRFGMLEKPIGFYLEGEGLRFARVLALVSEQVGDIQRFHFAGVVPTIKERDALIASLAGHEWAQERLSRYLVAVDQEGKGSLEAARNLARLYLTGREIQDVLSLEIDLLAQLDWLLRSFGYRLPDDPVVRDAALTLLRAT